MIKVKNERIKCLFCGKDIQRTSNNQKYCLKCSFIKAKESRNLFYKRKANLKDKFVICVICGKKFEVKNKNIKYCSKKCLDFYYKNYRKKYRKHFAKTKKGRLYLRSKNNERRAMKKNILELFTHEEWLQKLEKTRGFCLKCGKKVGIMKLSLDHIYPISEANKDYLKTGIKRKYFIKDVQPLCLRCNIVKRNKIEEKKEVS